MLKDTIIIYNCFKFFLHKNSHCKSLRVGELTLCVHVHAYLCGYTALCVCGYVWKVRRLEGMKKRK